MKIIATLAAAVLATAFPAFADVGYDGKEILEKEDNSLVSLLGRSLLLTAHNSLFSISDASDYFLTAFLLLSKGASQS